DLLSALAQQPTGKPMRLTIGIDDVVPKEIAQRLLDAALSLRQRVQITCREGTLEQLLTAVQSHEIDLVLSDSPVTPSLNLRAHNHRLGSCDVSWMAAPELARKLRRGYPGSLHGAPVLLPTADTAIRRSIDQWLDEHDVRPFIVGEFEDYALLRQFAQAGRGAAPAPDVLVEQFREESQLAVLGAIERVRAEFYAISTERKFKHPAAAAIRESAVRVFAAGARSGARQRVARKRSRATR